MDKESFTEVSLIPELSFKEYQKQWKDLSVHFADIQASIRQKLHISDSISSPPRLSESFLISNIMDHYNSICWCNILQISNQRTYFSVPRRKIPIFWSLISVFQE